MTTGSLMTIFVYFIMLAVEILIVYLILRWLYKKFRDTDSKKK